MQTHRETETHTDIHTDTDRQTDRHTDTHTHTPKKRKHPTSSVPLEAVRLLRICKFRYF